LHRYIEVTAHRAARHKLQQRVFAMRRSMEVGLHSLPRGCQIGHMAHWLSSIGVLTATYMYSNVVRSAQPYGEEALRYDEAAALRDAIAAAEREVGDITDAIAAEVEQATARYDAQL
jgi:hypothetical protein